MIPQRVQLRGFMSYREAATFHFEGSKLWMLSGPNGAGKSTVFDAITFALYGVHRGGKLNARELINQGAQNLLVEFDFRIGEDDYRVKRTLARSGNPTYQAWHLRGPNPPAGAEGDGPHPIAGSDYKDGFENWVLQTVGLDELTFTASVMLQQGKSDALLEANPAKRHEMLSQIVGLEAYEKLHAKADNLRKEFEGAAKNMNVQLAGLPIVDAAQIDELTGQVEAASSVAREAQQRQVALAELRVRAEHWQALQSEYTAIEEVLRGTQELFAEAGPIEANAARLSELNTALPRLRELHDERERLRECDQNINHQNAAAAQARAAFEAAQARLADAQKRFADLQEQNEKYQALRQAAGERVLELGQHLPQLDELARARGEIEKLDAKLSQFASDLDGQIEAAREAATRGQEIKNALPWLRQFASSRAAFITLKNEAKQTDAELLPKKEDAERALKRLSELETRDPVLKREVLQAQERATELQTLREQIRKRVERLKSQENLAECEYCGQPLTAEHIEAEKNRIRSEFSQAGDDWQAAQKRRDELQAEQIELQKEISIINRRIARLNEDIYRLDCNRTKARELGQTEKQRAEEAFAALPPEYQRKIDSSGENKWPQLSSSFYPDDDDLRAAAQQAQEATTAQARLQTLQNQKAERDELRARRAPFASRLAELQREYSPQRESEIRSAHAQAQRQSDEAAQALNELKTPLATAQRDTENAARDIEAARETQQQTATRAAQENARREGIERAVQNAQNNLPAAWQSVAADLTSAQLNLWGSEAQSLRGADEKLAQLQAAQRENAGYLARQRQLENEFDDVPSAARRAPEDVAREEETAKGEHDAALANQRALESEKQRLEDLKARRHETEKTLHRVEKQAQLYKELASYLGRDRLQRYLLQQAETGIVSNANQVLDRISGGSLRIELRHDGSEAPTKAVRALDLLAYNTETGEDPMPVYLLSGSQRFRVAVSLALGIGQFAGTGTRRIESVIIDEGFGSLDVEGRREIIEELHNLKEELNRIILVSHQEEFADAFPHRYTIELKDGSSTATLMDETVG